MPKPVWWSEYVSEVVDTTEREVDHYRATVSRNRVVWETAVILLISAFSLLLINTFKGGGSWLQFGNERFDGLFRWSLVTIAGYTVLPLLVIRFVLKEPLSNFGAKLRGVGRYWKTFALLYAISVPFILFASTRPAFIEQYPFYKLDPGESWWPYLVLWWVLYALQFVALEFFFRGFMVDALKRRIGIAAVFVMVVPYVMIHFAKPPLEAMSAAFGGTALGFLSIKTGSFWWGAALHITIAATMDVLSLAQQGLL